MVPHKRHIIDIFSCTLVIIMTIIIIIRVVMRFFFNITPSWSEELTSLFMVWVTLLGITIGIRDKSHLSVSLIHDRLPRKVTIVFDIINIILILFFTGFVMFFNGLEMVRMVWSSRLASIPVSNAVLYLMMPIAGLLSLVIIVINLKGEIGELKKKLSKEALVDGC